MHRSATGGLGIGTLQFIRIIAGTSVDSGLHQQMLDVRFSENYPNPSFFLDKQNVALNIYRLPVYR
jgi:hypothetical protein